VASVSADRAHQETRDEHLTKKPFHDFGKARMRARAPHWKRFKS
jgi:hypothetical protein